MPHTRPVEPDTGPVGLADPRTTPGTTDLSGPAAPSRRFFVAGMGAGALAAGAASLGGVGLTGATAARPGSATDAPGALGADDGFVVYVRPGESELTFHSGEREVVVDDPALVRALTRKLGA